MLSGFTKLTGKMTVGQIAGTLMATAFESDCKLRKFDCKLVILLDWKRILEKLSGIWKRVYIQYLLYMVLLI
jgi:hypothetical protein